MSKSAALGRGLSIQQRLVLLISTLLLGVVVAYGWLAYREVRRSVLLAAEERLSSVTRQLQDLLAASTKNLIGGTRSVAADGAVTRRV